MSQEAKQKLFEKMTKKLKEHAAAQQEAINYPKLYTLIYKISIYNIIYYKYI